MRKKARIKTGVDADLSNFDPNAVIDEATFEKPAQYFAGFSLRDEWDLHGLRR
jgi:N-acyl-D-aspartate/D-glutamate deacylase